MKFDFVIGNPPYQEETETKSETNRQKPMTNIFHHFQIQADEIVSESSVMIYPGARWIHRFGKGLRQFGKDLINDKSLSKIEFYPNAKDVFNDAADIADGITIVVKKHGKTSNGFEYTYCHNAQRKKIHIENPGDDLLPLNPDDAIIVNKIKSFVSKYNLRYLNESILPRSLYNIESDFVENNPDKVRLLEDNSEIDYNSEIKLLTNNKAGKSGRACWYITNRDTITKNAEFIDEFQVVVSSANAGGQKRDNQIEIIDNHSAYGRSRVGLASFKTHDEATNFYNFAKTYFIRYAFLMTDEALNSLGLLVPDIIDYKTGSGLLNFNEDIDKQLFSLVGLTTDEIRYIIETVDKRRGAK